MADVTLFPRDQLHQGAAVAIDKDGAALLEAQQIGTTTPVEAPSFESRRSSSGTITSEDLAGEPMLGWSDLSGGFAGRYFVRDGKLVALRGEGYRQLRRLVEKIVKTKPFSRGFSDTFIEVEVFKWWRASLRDETKNRLSTHLLDAASVAYESHTVMIPLSNIEIERAFMLGAVLVTPFDSNLFDSFEKDGTNKFPEHAEMISKQAADLRKDLGHLTAVQVEIKGERDYAQDRAHKIATEVADIFRIMSPPAMSRNVRFACFPLGLEHEPKKTVLQTQDGKLSFITQGFLENPSFRWKLSLAELDRYMNDGGFRNCSVFFDDAPLTTFQKRLKNAFAAYAQAVAAIDLRNRLLYAVSAAEHLLLREDDGTIQASVGERLAFLIAKEAVARQSVVSNFKKAYGLRSRQIHHLVSVDDTDVLDTFFFNMWSMLTSAMQNLPRFKEHAEFLDALDRLKFS